LQNNKWTPQDFSNGYNPNQAIAAAVAPAVAQANYICTADSLLNNLEVFSCDCGANPGTNCFGNFKPISLLTVSMQFYILYI
jgi:hypothetical protein